MNNSHQKVVNGLDKFKIMAYNQPDWFLNHINDEFAHNDLIDFHKQRHNILLIDDYVDSRWTFTILGGMLSKLGHRVYPFSLGMVKK